jgi:hypothetical protein
LSRTEISSRRAAAPRSFALAVLIVGATVASVAQVGRAEEKAVPASVAEGRRLLAENGCDGACHRARTDDDEPTSLYRRPDRKVQSREELHRQVGFCVSRLGSMIFPEEIGSVVDALDHDHYHFD